MKYNGLMKQDLLINSEVKDYAKPVHIIRQDERGNYDVCWIENSSSKRQIVRAEDIIDNRETEGK